MTLPDPGELVDALLPDDGDTATGRVDVVEEPDTVAVGSEEGGSVGQRAEEKSGPAIRRDVIG